MNCPKCNSSQLEPVAGEFTTGVVAPDGYREARYQEGFQCLACGLKMDSEDVLPSPVEWSVTPTGEVFHYFI
jgi:hypothetical protein